MNVPKISICLLTYKRAAILGATIDSLLHQTFSDFELLINDDCSPDGTEQVCREYLKRDARVRYFRNLRNLRYSGNQNAAVSRAGSDFIAFVHDGDSYAPNMLERWYETLVKHPSAGLVFNAQSTLDLSGHVVRTSSHPYAELIPGRVMFDYVITKPSIPIWGILLCRRQVFDKVGLFDGRFPVLADVDMWLRIMTHYDICYIREPLFAVWPREPGHINRGINWKIERESETIHWLNLRRKQEITGEKWTWQQTDLDAMIRVKQLFGLAWCLRKGSGYRFVKGIQHVLGYQGRRETLTGQQLSTIPAPSS